MWDRNNPSCEYGFAGQLTIPRHVEVKDGKLLQYPVWDYSNKEEKNISNYLNDNFKYGALKLEIKDLKELEIKLRENDNQCFFLHYLAF